MKTSKKRAELSPGSRRYWERRGLLPSVGDISLPARRLRRFLEDCFSRGFRPARLFRTREAARAEDRDLHHLSFYRWGDSPLTADLIVKEEGSCYEPGSGQRLFAFDAGSGAATVISAFPDDPDLHLERIFADDPAPLELERRLGCFVEAHPNYKEGLIEWGNLLFAKGDYPEAAIFYRRCMELDPGCAEACYNLAGCHVRRNEYAAAIRLYHRSIRLRPDFPEALYSLGVLYLTLNYNRHARQTLQAVVALGLEEWAVPAGRFLRELEQPGFEMEIPTGDVTP